ncbi:ADP-ribosylglycohydrolase family protein [Actinomyces sp. MRS3W]|uniref:ADP-ribosylglycohydrolase family protein n=1 Tax=Actinomyces sp. MRS3W TaxID=2800796 RepID=UPI0028FD35D1|nr:ADP-ribosylglycohydrolase family protein [Actinomyces sp. MRS3W]MDU0349355.1 ADP-ribosylglycohydrolase family protein [Actinomyces sp. MRS3W]
MNSTLRDDAAPPHGPLTDSQLDRVEGVLLAQAVGDVMGVPYEPGDVPLEGAPQALGGGLGDYAPGEWSDDTQMSLYIAEVAATGADLTSEAALDDIARGWCHWVLEEGATDVGVQTRAVIEAVAASRNEPGIAARMRAAAAQLHERSGRTAGNDALMRNGIVGLSRLQDRRATAAAARAVAELTHADPLAGDCCVIHAEMIRSNIMNPPWAGMPYFGANPLATLDLIPAQRRTYWHDLFDGGALDATHVHNPPDDDGFTVNALGHATLAFVFANHSGHRSAAAMTRGRADTARVWMDMVLDRAVRASRDKDTVGAITGAIAGSYLGAGALDPQWVTTVHGLPRRADGAERDAENLRALARATAIAGLS